MIGNLEEQKKCLQRALKIQQDHSSQDNPDIIKTLAGFAMI